MSSSFKRGRKRKHESLWTALREAQRECGCNFKTLKTILKSVTPFLPAASKKNRQETDTELCRRTEAVVLELHGCVSCNDFVFPPASRDLRCPKCNHPRFNSIKKPNEVFWYLPLKHQLMPLLQNPVYRELLMWETRRNKATGYMADVYDTPRWKKVAGEPTKTLSRIVYQICVDGFPWQSRKHGVCTH